MSAFHSLSHSPVLWSTFPIRSLISALGHATCTQARIWGRRLLQGDEHHGNRVHGSTMETVSYQQVDRIDWSSTSAYCHHKVRFSGWGGGGGWGRASDWRMRLNGTHLLCINPVPRIRLAIMTTGPGPIQQKVSFKVSICRLHRR